MSHNIESMCYTNEVPWHGLGHYVENAPTVKKMLKLAKIDWTVERQPLYLAGDVEVESHAALVRSSDQKVLDVVGSSYIPTQNEQAFEFFTEFVESGDATMETAGSLQGGKLVWGLAKLDKGFTLRGQDRVEGYLLCVCPHKHGSALMFRTTAVRVVCNNTLTMALQESGTKWRMTHRSVFDGVKVDEAKKALGVAREQMGEFERNARLLQKLNISRDDVIKLLAPIYQPKMGKEKELSRVMEKVMGAYENAPGAQPGNGWGALNAVSYYTDHMAGRTNDARMASAWLGAMAQQKENVLEKLLEMAQ